MSKKLFRALKYVKNKPVEISVGISPEEAAQDNVGDDKAKLVFTTDRRIFLNGEEIARTKGDERPKPIVNKAIPLHPMIGSRYVVRKSKKSDIRGKFRLQFIVLKNAVYDDDTTVDLNALFDSLRTVFGNNVEIGELYIFGYSTFEKQWLRNWMTFSPIEITHSLPISAGFLTFVATFVIGIPNLDSEFFVIRVKNRGRNILEKPEFEAEVTGDINLDTNRYLKFRDEPTASPHFELHNGKVYCVKMPNVPDVLLANIDDHNQYDGLNTLKFFNNLYGYRKRKKYNDVVIPFKESLGFKEKKNAWVRITSEGDYYNSINPMRFYPVKNHGFSCKDQSIHFVEFRVCNLEGKIIKNGTP